MGAASSKRRSDRQPANSPAQRKGPMGNPSDDHLSFTIHSDHTRSREIQDRIIERVEHHRYGEKSLFSIKLALEEAMINAIKHGNKNDPKKLVMVEARVEPKQIQISIEDQGPGFDRSSVPDPTAEENLCKCSGRGILLIESYMDSVTWSNNGRRLTMVKHNAP